MDGIYNICRGGEKIGKAYVSREGLYYRFRCCCTLTGAVIYRLTAVCGDKTENLGILIPDGDAFRLEKRLPVSRFSGGRMEIKAVPGNPERKGIFAPVHPDEPFRYIAALQKARMEWRDGQAGVVFTDDQPSLTLVSKSK